MAKPKNLTDALLAAAIDRAGYVLKPYPKGIDPNDADKAVGELRDQGLVHGSRREPNLTREGLEMARALAA
jgi:hypothetical protein